MKRIVSFAAALTIAVPVQALEPDPRVPPEINVGGRALISVDGRMQEADDGSEDHESTLNSADSSLLFGFSKYLFDDGQYGFAVIGIKTVEDEEGQSDTPFLHEMHAGLGGVSWELKGGRSRLPNTLLSFPTLRDDDLLEFTHVPNAQDDEGREEHVIYGGQLAGRWWAAQRLSLLAALTARARTEENGESAQSGSFNGGALGLLWEQPEEAAVGRGLRFAGLLVDHQTADQVPALDLDDGEITAALAAFSYVFNDNPEAEWRLDLQGMWREGDAEGLGSAAHPVQRARADARGVVAALRHVHRPWLQTQWQAALTVAWQEYEDDGRAWAVVPSVTRRLGSGINVTAQYLRRENDDALATATGLREEQRIELGLSFAFDHTFNESVGGRGSILSLEHGIADVGPVGGGH